MCDHLINFVIDPKGYSDLKKLAFTPYYNAEENRKYFKELYQLYVDIKNKNIDNGTMSVLSMGMTGDFEVAVEEGATMIRVGTGIFGSR